MISVNESIGRGLMMSVPILIMCGMLVWFILQQRREMINDGTWEKMDIDMKVDVEKEPVSYETLKFAEERLVNMKLMMSVVKEDIADQERFVEDLKLKLIESEMDL